MARKEMTMRKLGIFGVLLIILGFMPALFASIPAFAAGPPRRTSSPHVQGNRMQLSAVASFNNVATTENPYGSWMNVHISSSSKSLGAELRTDRFLEVTFGPLDIPGSSRTSSAIVLVFMPPEESIVFKQEGTSLTATLAIDLADVDQSRVSIIVCDSGCTDGDMELLREHGTNIRMQWELLKPALTSGIISASFTGLNGDRFAIRHEAILEGRAVGVGEVFGLTAEDFDNSFFHLSFLEADDVRPRNARYSPNYISFGEYGGFGNSPGKSREFPPDPLSPAPPVVPFLKP